MAQVQGIRNKYARTVIFTDNRRVFPVCLRVLGVEDVPAQLPRAPSEPVVEPRKILRCIGEVESHVRLDSQLDAVGTRLEVRKAQKGVVHARYRLLQIRRHTFGLLSTLSISGYMRYFRRTHQSKEYPAPRHYSH